MKKSLWEPKRRIELAYMRALKKLFKSLEMKIKGINNPFKIINTLKQIAKSKKFKDYAEASALKMATHVFSDVGKNWREAAKENGKGREIYKAIQNELDTEVGSTFKEIISNNSKLIKSVPEDMCEYVSKYVAKESMKGKRASEIAEELQEKFPDLNKNRATLIAKTETSKASTALTEARSKDIGSDWYVWKTSQDGNRVRSSHRKMEGAIINWNNPPSPESLRGVKSYGEYHAGNTFNCRCYPAPIITLSRIKFPAKVYHDGRIQTMTKVQFEKIM